ncbi:RDD family protein [Cellulomonas edaphi]|uniref:RDD family protein n=1 Tax=Cellulomonas edaphi TaxID=3053468 RepID=A0ABT7S332_9CELL|nr:RDD family protein [Cellulomons edaphi]MDM7830025.1 RDD family protein [Cellulomons edaphi]
MTRTPEGPGPDPDDEQQGASPAAWLPTPTVPFPRPAPLEEPVRGDEEQQRRPAQPPRPPYASWSRRAAGFGIDVAVMTLPLVLALTYDDAVVAALGVTWWLAWFVGNRVVAQGSSGITLGRRVTGSQLRRAGTGRPPGWRVALVRELAHVADAVWLVGFLWPLWDERRRTFADSMCGTTVVRTR